MTPRVGSRVLTCPTACSLTRPGTRPNPAGRTQDPHGRQTSALRDAPFAVGDRRSAQQGIGWAVRPAALVGPARDSSRNAIGRQLATKYPSDGGSARHICVAMYPLASRPRTRPQRDGEGLAKAAPQAVFAPQARTCSVPRCVWALAVRAAVEVSIGSRLVCPIHSLGFGEVGALGGPAWAQCEWRARWPDTGGGRLARAEAISAARRRGGGGTGGVAAAC